MMKSAELQPNVRHQPSSAWPLDGTDGGESDSLVGVAAHFDRHAEHYDDKYRSDRPRHLYEHEKRERVRWTRRWVRQYARQNPAGLCLDVGCGDGRFLQHILQSHVSWQGMGIDVSRNMIQIAKSRCAIDGTGDRAIWDVGTLDQVGQRVNAVISLGVVGYQVDQLPFLSQLAACVRPAGLLIFTFANALSVPRRIRTSVQAARRLLTRRSANVVFQTLRLRQVDEHMSKCGMRRLHLRWLCYGIGLPRSDVEVSLSGWCERRLSKSRWAEPLAQVALVCYQNCRSS